MTIKEIEEIVGTLSKPSKMPCHGYSIPAIHCKIGSLLAKRKGTVCSDCYALKGRYIFPNVIKAMQKRFDSLTHPNWVGLMTELISRKEKSRVFRWHDSGDLQGFEHLANICQVGFNLPNIKFWLPTREYRIVEDYREEGGRVPDNLIIRLSAHKVDGDAPHKLAKRLGVETSEVRSKAGADMCPAPQQGNQCLDCRKCWTRGEKVTYLKH